MNISSSSYILIVFAMLLAPISGMDDEIPKLRGTRSLTLAEDFVKNQSSTFDYNVIIRQEEKNIENEQKGKGRKKKGKRSKKNKDNSSNIIYGAWRTAQCVPSGEPCYVGDSCCNGDKCPSCNIGPCLCD